MDTVIREGALRLHTTEACCDVILSCQGQRLMAHRLILSIASPVLKDLLLQDYSEPTVIILPDVNGNTMSLVLDYIYSGSVVVYSNTIEDFLEVSKLLKLKLDTDYFKICKNADDASMNDVSSSKCKTEQNHKFSLQENVNSQEKSEQLDVVSPNSPEVYSKKSQRKIPNLLPIKNLHHKKSRSHKNLCNYVIPSPWCPRISPVLADPRMDHLVSSDSNTNLKIISRKEENDNNNNSQSSLISTLSEIYSRDSRNIPSYFGTKQDDVGLREATKSLQSYNMFPYQSFARHNIFDRYPYTSLNENQNYTKEVDKTYDNATYIHPKINKSVHITKIQNEQNVPVNHIISSNSISANQIQIRTENKGLPNEEKADDELSIANDRSNSPKRATLKNEMTEDEMISETLELNKDMEKNERQKPFKCEECGKCFSQLRNFKYHRSVHEGTKEFAAKCPECGKVFNDRGYLSSHMKIHRDRKEYACPHCPKRFNQRVAYNMHLRIHTGVKPHECPTCGKSFSRKMLLKQHQRVHTGERPYSCPECGKTFADRSNMSLHARLHTGIKPYACSLCPKSFTKKHHLKTHMNFHTGLKPYTCQKCGLAFSQSSNMRTHYKKCILKNSGASNSPTTSNTSEPENLSCN